MDDSDVAEALVAGVREAKNEDAAVALVLAATRPTDDLTEKRARELAERVRHPSCATEARGLLLSHVDGVDSLDQAEALVASVREADSVDDAARRIMSSARRAKRPVDLGSFPQKLSETGWLASMKTGAMAKGFVPYDVNSPLWSDGASKHRFVRVPDGGRIGFKAKGAWDFPAGTTFLQTLYFGEGEERQRVETRVIVHTGKGLRFASYIWDEDDDEATLEPQGTELYVSHGDTSQLWASAARKQCSKCHNDAVGLVQGVTTAQLNRGSQLRRLAEIGLLVGVPEETASLPRLADPHDAQRPLDMRARSYLHTNCANCHRPGGPGSGTLDLRLHTAFDETGLVKDRTSAGRGGVVRPGHPGRSRLVQRMSSLEWDRMPNLMSTVPDEKGIAMLKAWIRSMEASRAAAGGE